MPEQPPVIPEALRWFIAQHPWPNEVMYHYTTPDALQNILTTRQVWATDLRAMNDPEELRYSKALIDQRIEASARLALNPIKSPWLNEVHKVFHKYFSGPSLSFSISFSEHADLPRQWQDYASGGTGFVLGWSIDSEYPQKPLPMWVTYDPSRQESLIDGLIEVHFDYLGHVVVKGEEPLRAWTRVGLSLAIMLDIVLQTFKETKWSSEAEFRYVYQFFEGYIPIERTFKTREGGGVQKRYIDADFSQAALRRVLIGPCNDFDSTALWLRELLDRNGFKETAIVRSSVKCNDLPR